VRSEGLYRCDWIFPPVLICVPNGGRTAAKDEKGVEDSREAKLRVCQGYKLFTRAAGLGAWPCRHALAA
jgi:hypothetical protein